MSLIRTLSLILITIQMKTTRPDISTARIFAKVISTANFIVPTWGSEIIASDWTSEWDQPKLPRAGNQQTNVENGGRTTASTIHRNTGTIPTLRVAMSGTINAWSLVRERLGNMLLWALHLLNSQTLMKNGLNSSLSGPTPNSLALKLVMKIRNAFNLAILLSNNHNPVLNSLLRLRSKRPLWHLKVLEDTMVAWLSVSPRRPSRRFLDVMTSASQHWLKNLADNSRKWACRFTSSAWVPAHP